MPLLNKQICNKYRSNPGSLADYVVKELANKSQNVETFVATIVENRTIDLVKNNFAESERQLEQLFVPHAALLEYDDYSLDKYAQAWLSRLPAEWFDEYSDIFEKKFALEYLQSWQDPVLRAKSIYERTPLLAVIAEKSAGLKVDFLNTYIEEKCPEYQYEMPPVYPSALDEEAELELSLLQVQIIEQQGKLTILQQVLAAEEKEKKSKEDIALLNSSDREVRTMRSLVKRVPNSVRDLYPYRYVLLFYLHKENEPAQCIKNYLIHLAYVNQNKDYEFFHKPGVRHQFIVYIRQTIVQLFSTNKESAATIYKEVLTRVTNFEETRETPREIKKPVSSLLTEALDHPWLEDIRKQIQEAENKNTLEINRDGVEAPKQETVGTQAGYSSRG